MSSDSRKRREELFQMEPELHGWAATYTPDANLAYALVHHTLLKSYTDPARPDEGTPTRTWLASVMWNRVCTMQCFRSLRYSGGQVH
ncbi:hypothetical protein [Iodidimonas sp. SYSU 1G8]|uniref:hypothetical protein n=1 Tax=Iodidimonas sp. SYSU 1G8 TaxID=3133967 RepID=UPI0031FF282B